MSDTDLQSPSDARPRLLRCFCGKHVKAIGLADHQRDAHGVKKKKQRAANQCDFPGCAATDAKRIDIQTNWFRGDDVVMLCCPEHRKPEHEKALLATDKAKRQMA